ncbi:MAG TPA: hypothetical protein VN539_03710, partial [Candidatus Saccharimonadales bacterium]|nr:hypothetical protein [Candidatus Saccharimonadales bacterium]
MTRQRGLWAGIFVLAILTGCSNKDKTLNVEGSYTPVILNFSANNQPPVRGVPNALTAIVQNPRGYAITYHWSTAAGTISDSTSATAQWTPPDAIGDYAVTVSIQAHDDLNGTDFFKTRTFQIHADNQFTRWTRSIATQLDVVPPVNGKIYWSEIRSTSTGESDVWAVSTPLGSPEQITHGFWQTTQPTVQSDGSRVAFLGKVRPSTGGASIWYVPPTGGDTTSATLVVGWSSNANHFLGGPRFAPTGSMLAYASDTTSANFFQPKGWMRDAGNLAAAPIPLMPTTLTGSGESSNGYWNPAWRGSADSVVMESYTGFGQANATARGLYKFSASGNPPTNPEPFSLWYSDLLAFEPDWSPDGQHIVF